MGFNSWEIGLVLVIVLIFFGAGKLPDVFRQAGKGIRAFKDAAAGKDEAEDTSSKGKSTPKTLTENDDLDDDPVETKATSAKRHKDG